MENLVLLSFLFILFILIKNRKSQTLILFNTTLTGLVVYTAAHFFVNHGDYKIIAAILFNHFTPLYLLVGPCYYLFILKKLNKLNKLRPIHLIHALPALIQLIAIIPYFCVPWTQKLELIAQIYSDPNIQESINVNLFFSPKLNYAVRLIHFTTYCIICLSLVRKSLKNKTNTVEPLKSLKKITIVFLLLTLFYSLHIIVILVSNSYYTGIIKTILFIDTLLFMSLLIEILKHPELIFSTNKFKTSYLDKSPFSSNSKFENNIPKSIYNDIEKKIVLMINDRSFLIKSSTNFDVFCKKIKQNKFHIRSYLKSNGTTFILLKNRARVAEALKYLESEKNYKLDFVAKKSGFNTRSNFFKIFKKIMGCTPSQYEKSKI